MSTGGKKVTTASVSPRQTICQRCGTRSRSPNQANSGPPVAAERNAVEPGVGDRHRLHRDRLVVAAQLGHAEQRAAEGQHARAVAAGALGEQHEVVAGVQPAHHLVAAARWSCRCCRSMKMVRCALASVEKNGQVATSALATKLPGDQSAQHLDVEIGDVVADVEGRRHVRARAVHAHLDAEDDADEAVIDHRHPADDRLDAQRAGQQIERHQQRA